MSSSREEKSPPIKMTAINRLLSIRIKDVDGTLQVFDFDDGTKYSSKAPCLDGSTKGCIKESLNACASDGVCAFVCGYLIKQCLSAIAAACLVHCNK